MVGTYVSYMYMYMGTYYAFLHGTQYAGAGMIRLSGLQQQGSLSLCYKYDPFDFTQNTIHPTALSDVPVTPVTPSSSS